MSLQRERALVRRLAEETRELAQSPAQREKRVLWRALNDLKPQRPMVWITEIPWGEFEDRHEELRPECVHPLLREYELYFRRRLFVARHLHCDELLYDYFPVARVLEGARIGPDVVEQRLAQGASPIQSHHYEPILRDFEDLEKIAMPRVRCDVEATERKRAFATELFDGILPVRLHGVCQHWFAAWDEVVHWTGVTEALIALHERPDFIHALMRRYTDAFLMLMDQLEQQDLLDDSSLLPRVGSGGTGLTSALPQPDARPGRWRPIDQWGGATPQIFSEVSPAMHAEFALRYEIEVMSRCGLNYYGCCEPLHDKMDILAEAPRVRKISISPWCNTAAVVARARQRYVLSHKPSPALMAGDRFDPARAEADLRARLSQSEGMPCEFVMKDISTVRGDPQRLMTWCQIAWRLVNE